MLHLLQKRTEIVSLQNLSVSAESRICYFLNFHDLTLLTKLLFHSFSVSSF